ncbi:SdpI family protein [Ornithinibacillus sp. FSL M8-0202]|uniref:SdpI family protein n=1 Tax=Ornithinibacillus sp. FSL M8-0202 TaxID=2921616 RepID=UPI0030CE2C1E
MNALFGVRTAWSMKNDESWRNSNRLGSTLMFAWGAFSIVASILLPSEYVMATVLTVGLIILLMVVYGSYYFYRKSIR